MRPNTNKFINTTLHQRTYFTYLIYINYAESITKLKLLSGIEKRLGYMLQWKFYFYKFCICVLGVFSYGFYNLQTNILT